ncbi:MAG: LCP family protein [Candidatus Buchananbacteria bacterium]|nr:LCP family protein [Candidatus Buchananbacteria bacterium]
MRKVKVNLLSDDNEENIKTAETEKIALANNRYRPKRKYNLKKIIASVIIVIVICLAVFSSSIVFSDENLIKNLAKLNLLQQMGRLIGAGSKDLIGEDEDRISVLLIGMGGSGHEGGTLADTIILGSFKPSTNQVAMLSIPRDLSVKTANYDWTKINAINAYAEKKEEGSGGREMASVLNDLVDTNIKYYVTVDFSGFERLIDEFGGVDVYVERDLIDMEYPIRGKEDIFPIENRYETLNIKKGQQHMDGATALKYARSRHALGIEGSDFARSKRQQNILSALKDKVFHFDTILNPKKLNSLLTAYNEHISTNLEIWQLLKLAQMAKDIDTSKIINHTLSDASGGLVHSQIINGAYVLIPNDGNFEAIKKLWQNIFYTTGTEIKTVGSTTVYQSTNQLASTSATTTDNQVETKKTDNTLPKTLTADYKTEGATIEIRNGTWITGYASKQQSELETKGFDVTSAGNADNHDYAKTLIYDFSKGKNPGTTLELAKIYGTSVITSIPVSLSSSANFLIILGQD